MMLARQISHELFKLFARQRTYIGFGAFVVLQLVILGLLQIPAAEREVDGLLTRNGLNFDDYYSGLTLGLLVVVFTFMLLGALYIALVAGDIVAKEVEDGTMRIILARPVSRLRLLLVKWIACAVYSATLIVFLGITALVAGVIHRGGLGKLFVFVHEEQLFAFYETAEGLWRYARAVLFLSFSVVLIASTAFMFSCFRMKPAAATILTLSVFFVDLILRSMPFFRSFQDYFITHHTAHWVRTLHVNPPWLSIAESVTYLVALNATCWIIGATRFCTRDLKS